MKKSILLTVCLVAFAITGNAQKSAYKGEKGVTSIGLNLGYAVDYKSLAIGVDYRYNILDRVRLAPSITYIVKNDNNASAWYGNLDFHYICRATNNLSIYPIGGVGVGIHKYETIKLLDSDDTETRIGLNIGCGGEYRITRDIILGIEWKYNMTTERAFDQNFIMARAAYYF